MVLLNTDNNDNLTCSHYVAFLVSELFALPIMSNPTADLCCLYASKTLN